MRQETPKALRLHLGIFGRTNVGKSSVLNYISGQDTAITSPHRGTTTDVVEKTMELLPLGPVVFLDTAGLDDISELSPLRIKKTKLAYDRTDIFILVTEPSVWGEYEEDVLKEAKNRKVPAVVIINKADTGKPKADFVDSVSRKVPAVFTVSAISEKNKEAFLHEFKKALISLAPAEFFSPPKMFSGLLKKGDTVVFVIPIDSQAPKGRLILPQVQAIRESLDDGIISVVTTDKTLKDALSKLKNSPQLVVCDSQVVEKIHKETPKGIRLTTFSMLLSRAKGGLSIAVESAGVIRRLRKGDKVLISEACSHHPLKEDIGRIKIPKWTEEYLGYKIAFDICAGKDFPDDLSKYKLIIHCGGCMINSKNMLSRLNAAKLAGVPITNYGVCISYLKGVLQRTASPFPELKDIS